MIGDAGPETAQKLRNNNNQQETGRTITATGCVSANRGKKETTPGRGWNLNYLVRLMRQLSNPSLRLLNVPLEFTVEAGLERSLARSAEGVKRHRRLSPAEVSELADQYVGGLTVDQLAAKWSINRGTVMGHLKRQSVQTRRPSGALEGERLAEATELYRSGVSLNRLGKRFELDPKTVRARLAESGVEIRSRGRVGRRTGGG